MHRIVSRITAALVLFASQAGAVPPTQQPSVAPFVGVTAATLLPLDVSPELGLTGAPGGEVEGWDWSPTQNLHWVFRLSGIEQRNDDATWSINASNYSIFTGSLAGRDHQGGGTLGDDGVMYSTVEAYSSCASFSNQAIAVWNMNATPSRTIDVSGQGAEASGVSVAGGTAYVTSYCASTIAKYRVSDGAFLGNITTSPAITAAQGVKYYNGALLVTGIFNNVYSLVSVDPGTGNATLVYAYPTIFTNIESPGIRNGKVGVGVLSQMAGVNYDRIVFGALPGTTVTVPGTATVWPNGDVSVGSVANGPAPVSRLQVNGSLVVGQQFQGQTAPTDGLAVQGRLSLGSVYGRAQLDMGCQQAAAGCGIQILWNNAGGAFWAYSDTSWGAGSNKFFWGTSTTPSTANIKMALDFGTGNLGVGTTAPGQKIEVNGGMRLNTATAQPTCASAIDGTFWVVQGTTGVKDSVQVCAKDASNAYAWRTIY